MKQILVLNSGSSSIKYELFDMVQAEVLDSGIVERIGEDASRLVGSHATVATKIVDHAAGIDLIRLALAENDAFDSGRHLVGIGHRVVHGGEAFSKAARVDDAVIRSISDLAPLAPLHNPANLMGITVAQKAFPGIPQVAVFDTAFHQTLPPTAFQYAIPTDFYHQHGVRRYGFHGTSHRHVCKRVAEHLGVPPTDLNLIIFHLGGGASAAAIRGGRSIDTSMGMTPLEGLVMGTRSGDLDPAIVLHLAGSLRMTPAEIDDLLNRQSGLKGLCGENDMREVLSRVSNGDPDAVLALEIFCYRIKKYLGSYLAVLGRTDAIVFTGGIGENAPEIRRRSCDGMETLGISLLAAKNEHCGNGPIEIQSGSSRIRIMVVPTNEELEIAEQTLAIVGA